MSKARTIASHLKLAQECLQDARTLLAIGSRNAAYLASQSAEHVLKAIATSEDIHIERKDAHQLDTVLRSLPDANRDKPTLAKITFLEAYATAYRYPTPVGRTPDMPPAQRIEEALREIGSLIGTLQRHFGCDPAVDGAATRVDPRR